MNDAYEQQFIREWPLVYMYEVFIKRIQEETPDSHIVLFVSCAMDYCQNIRDLMSLVARIHHVTIVNYFDVTMCAALIENPYQLLETRNRFWDRTYHPTWKVEFLVVVVWLLLWLRLLRFIFRWLQVHQLLADTVAYALFREEAPEACLKDVSLAPDKAFTELALCKKPTTFFSALEADTTREGIRTNGGWQLYADREHKPGWIATQPNSDISFEVKFGLHPRIVITYLRSYEKIGNATMTLNNRTFTLKGKWDDPTVHVSQSHTAVFQAFHDAFQDDLGENGLIGFNVKPNSAHEVKFQFIPTGPDTKFKLIGVETC